MLEFNNEEFEKIKGKGEDLYKSITEVFQKERFLN